MHVGHGNLDLRYVLVPAEHAQSKVIAIAMSFDHHKSKA